MIEVADNAFKAVRRRYRHARTVRTLRSASQRAHRNGQRVVHMLHVGKTGGTAVQQALTDAEPLPGLRLLLHGHGISLRDIPDGDEVFFFLREPVARFVSGFEMRRHEGRPRHYKPWTSAERRAFSRFGSAESLALALGSGVELERTEAERAMRGIYHVKSHLSDWLVSEEAVRARRAEIVFVGWQERLESDFQKLVGLLGLPPTTSLPQGAYEANRASADGPQHQLSDDAAATLREWYADDYRFIALLKDLDLTEKSVEVNSTLAAIAVR